MCIRDSCRCGMRVDLTRPWRLEDAAVRIRDGLLVRNDNALKRSFTIGEPVTGPDPVKAPAESFELLLAESVSISRRRARVIARTIAFDREHVSTGLSRMLSREVDPVRRRAELRDDRDTGGDEPIAHLDLERVELGMLAGLVAKARTVTLGVD